PRRDQSVGVPVAPAPPRYLLHGGDVSLVVHLGQQTQVNRLGQDEVVLGNAPLAQGGQDAPQPLRGLGVAVPRVVPKAGGMVEQRHSVEVGVAGSRVHVGSI